MHTASKKLGNGSGQAGNNRNSSFSRKSNSRSIRSVQDFFNSLDSKCVITFVAGCVIFTILLDTYFLWPRDPPVLTQQNSGPFVTTPKKITTVQRPSERKDRFANLPPLKKANRNFNKTEDAGEYGREPILQVFRDAGIPPLNSSMVALLPTWNKVVQAVGSHPVIGGLDTCETFRQNVSAVERMLGSAGMFNSGTNLVTHLLKGNCRIPERVQAYGEDASKEAHG
jgi:hypothetical protein